MRATILRSALSLFLGLLAPSFAGSIGALQSGGASQAPPSKPQRTDDTYTRLTMGTGRIEDRTSSLGGFKGPNGEIISTVRADFGIIAAAKAAHQHVDRSAAEIVKQEDILDASGKVIGYRSVLTLADKDGKKSIAVVITKGGDFSEYIASSLRDVLAFEAYMKSLDAEHPPK